MAITSFILGVLSVILCTIGLIFMNVSWMAHVGFALGAIGLIGGIMALRHHRRESKRGTQGVWGMIFSIIGIIEWVIVLIFILPK